MKELKEAIETIRTEIGRGSMIQASNKIVDVLLMLEARVEAIEARNREKDCVCQKKDETGEFKIVKKLNAEKTNTKKPQK